MSPHFLHSAITLFLTVQVVSCCCCPCAATLCSVPQSKPSGAPQEQLAPLVVCGPSGVGKGTLLKMLLAEFGARAQYAVSHTTRAPRAGEVNGQHYHFVSIPEFEKLIADGSMIEYAKVHANYYGRSSVGIQHLVQAGKLCILEVDIQGAETMAKTSLGAHFLFVEPPSFEQLSARLVGRCA